MNNLPASFRSLTDGTRATVATWTTSSGSAVSVTVIGAYTFPSGIQYVIRDDSGTWAQVNAGTLADMLTVTTAHE